MTEKIDAKLDQAKGTIKETVGKLTDDKKIEAEGVVDKVAGKIKEVAADVKGTVEGIIDGVKKHTDNDEAGK
ncbi:MULTISPECIES: CsbD family protein [Streptococcus]|uniref:CsbD family protein n=1 Tax=Streptococcus ruminantium TaxID=1917441 RepID=A0A2Z5TN45_9STRE|nr:MULTISPECIES: CsbD family protein [Streptococcus]MDQ8758541.1 CsbD family protein [Streptococcus ruminantium]MDQ8765069.1 CsbD family protein [Streptococcus ruminantium]MDQ8768099.1 CsbD family protein [Streptococcus ruminantium]MDQ8774004.1 CsbD family protein [Streptococcus ruminantium]MDQ8794245.1 CsbD family protein [Streptococcus ruminantium]